MGYHACSLHALERVCGSRLSHTCEDAWPVTTFTCSAAKEQDVRAAPDPQKWRARNFLLLGEKKKTACVI